MQLLNAHSGDQGTISQIHKSWEYTHKSPAAPQDAPRPEQQLLQPLPQALIKRSHHMQLTNHGKSAAHPVVRKPLNGWPSVSEASLTCSRCVL